MRLLSFLTDTEHALVAEAGMAGGGTWEVSRMVNYTQGLARMTLTERTGTNRPEVKGQILLQSFTLADGSICLKANLNWQGSNQSSVMAVYSKPRTNWRAEAGMVASAWLSGPPEIVSLGQGAHSEELAPLAASA
jgi:hypothetical protein